MAQRRRLSAWWVGPTIMIVLFVGLAMAPPDLGAGALSATFREAARVGAVALVLVSVASLLVGLRNPTDTKAEAFLARTQPSAS